MRDLNRRRDAGIESFLPVGDGNSTVERRDAKVLPV